MTKFAFLKKVCCWQKIKKNHKVIKAEKYEAFEMRRCREFYRKTFRNFHIYKHIIMSLKYKNKYFAIIY